MPGTSLRLQDLRAEVAVGAPDADGIAAAEGVFDLASPLSESRIGAKVAPLLLIIQS